MEFTSGFWSLGAGCWALAGTETSNKPGAISQRPVTRDQQQAASGLWVYIPNREMHSEIANPLLFGD